MALFANLAPTGASVGQDPARSLASRDRRKADQILRVMGRARKVVPVKAGRVAAILGHSEGMESRIRSGERMSPSGRAGLAVYEAAVQEARKLERAGYVSAYIEATLKAIAMWPELERLTTEELHAELRREIVRHETRHNSICNELEADYLHDGRLDTEKMLDAHTKQATSSERIVAILQVLAERAR